MPLDLATIWALIIGFAALLYVLLDGFDLGVGILFGLTRDEDFRAAIMESVAPVWDGNETWLIFVGASLFAGFPIVYSILLPAFYIPLTVLLVALILRGVAFEFRHQSRGLRWLWDAGFFLGSLTAAFVQGAAVGAMVDILPVENGQFVGGGFEWLTPFALACGSALVVGYVLLGASWLVLKTEGPLREWAYLRVLPSLFAILIFLVGALAYALVTELRVMQAWSAHPWLLIFPALGALATVGLIWGVRTRRDAVPFAMSALIFLAAFATMAGSFWPYMIPYSVTIADAAAPESSLKFLFYGAGLVVLPVILAYTAAVYWVFRGKLRGDTSYH